MFFNQRSCCSRCCRHCCGCGHDSNQITGTVTGYLPVTALAFSPALPLQTMSTPAPVGTVEAAAPARYIKCEHRPVSGGTYRRVGGAMSGLALCT